jgi:hypothetical protein
LHIQESGTSSNALHYYKLHPLFHTCLQCSSTWQTLELQCTRMMCTAMGAQSPPGLMTAA